MSPYIIVSASTATKLQLDVCYKIAEGYIPLGGVTITREHGSSEFYQAMILRTA